MVVPPGVPATINGLPLFKTIDGVIELSILCRGDSVGFAANRAIHVRHAGFYAEIIHFVVQQKAGFADNSFASVPAVERGGYCHSIALLVVNAQVGCFFTFRANHARLDLGTVACTFGIVKLHPLGYIAVAGQFSTVL
jgi:hypothetical protein